VAMAISACVLFRPLSAQSREVVTE
jgi:hypothetical protein